MLRIFIFLTLLLSVSGFSFAQRPGFVFNHISVNDGLSENSVRAITEDQYGFMWFGTEDGLNKYDGYKFTIYKKNPNDIYSISNSNIKSFYIDKKKNLWILTADGLNLYDPSLNSFYNFKNNKIPALKFIKGDIEDIKEDKTGNMWVVAYGGLYNINSFNKAPEKFNFFTKGSNLLFYSLMLDSDTSIWVGTRDGLLKFNTINKTFTDLRLKYGQGYEVNKIHKDSTGNLWLATTNGLKIIDTNGKMKEYIHSESNLNSINGNNIVDIIPYKNGNYLIGIDGGGLDYFEVNNQQFHHYTDENESQLSSNNVISLFKDSKEEVWVGSYLNGINLSNGTTNLFTLIKNNPYSDKKIQKGIVTGILRDKKETFWVATDGGGLYRKNKGSSNYLNYRAGSSSLSSNNIISMTEDQEGNIWVCTYGGGICKFDPKRNKFKTYKTSINNPYSISNDKVKEIWEYDDKIWTATYGSGLSVLNKKTEKFNHYRYDKFYPKSIPSDWILCKYIDKNGVLWLGSYNGLSKYDQSRNTFKNYSIKSQIKDNPEINCISEDKNGNLWLGTGGGGLILFNKKDETCKVFDTYDGLSNNFIKGIVEDDNSNLWLSTNNGITKFNTNTCKGVAYTVKDGLPPCSFSFNTSFKGQYGRVIFGTNNGYLIIYPNMSEENKIIPPIVITDFKIFHEPVYAGKNNSPLKYDISQTKELTLPYDQNTITFEFAALNFNGSENNNYSYWLEGFEKKWNKPTKQRFATYTNLGSGKYIFRVRGSNNDDVWNVKGATIKIIITPPFWKTWWFVSIVIMSLTISLYYFYIWRIRKVRIKNILLEKMVKQRTRELKDVNEQLEAFVYKASHDIKGPLRSIIGLTTIGRKDVKDEIAITYFDHILKSTKKLDTLLMDLLEISRVKQATVQNEKINFNELVSEALASFENFPGYNRMIFDINIKEGTEFYSDKKLLYSIIQNLIENPIKYADVTKPESTLSIQITTSEKGVDLIFRDNGIGIQEEHHKKVFDMFFKVYDSPNGTGLGLYIVKTTVEKLNGTITLESSKGKGSTFHVKI